MDGLPFPPSLSTCFLRIAQREPHFISISSEFADHELAEELLRCGFGKSSTGLIKNMKMQITAGNVIKH